MLTIGTVSSRSVPIIPKLELSLLYFHLSSSFWTDYEHVTDAGQTISLLNQAFYVQDFQRNLLRMIGK